MIPPLNRPPIYNNNPGMNPYNMNQNPGMLNNMPMPLIQNQMRQDYSMIHPPMPGSNMNSMIKSPNESSNGNFLNKIKFIFLEGNIPMPPEPEPEESCNKDRNNSMENNHVLENGKNENNKIDDVKIE